MTERPGKVPMPSEPGEKSYRWFCEYFGPELGPTRYEKHFPTEQEEEPTEEPEPKNPTEDLTPPKGTKVESPSKDSTPLPAQSSSGPKKPAKKKKAATKG